jgi:zinc protease
VVGGAEDLSGPAFQQRLAALGSQMAVESTEDYSTVEVESLLPHWQASLDLLSDLVLHPALPQPEIEAQRQLQLSALQREQDDPEGLLAERSHALFYHGLPSANRAVGTIASVARIGRAELLRHLVELRQKSHWLLVVVGDVDPVEVAAWAAKAFAEVPRGGTALQPLEAPRFSVPRVDFTASPSAKTYVMAAFSAPSWGDPELAVAAVAINVFREKVFEELRLKHQLAVAPRVGLLHGAGGEGFFQFSAECAFRPS